MSCWKLMIRLNFQKFSGRKFHSSAERSSNWREVMKKESETSIPEENKSVCIYKVPSFMRLVEPKAYRPSNFSIGPYHYKAPHLQETEMLKTKFFRRLFDPSGLNGSKLDMAMTSLESLEDKIRNCYMYEIKLSRDEFLKMVLIDASFIVQLLRDLSENEFRKVPSLSRWMLPTIRRELIMLENQLPLFLLNELFNLTKTEQCETLKSLALRFFYPLLQAESDIPESKKADECEDKHFLGLLRSSMLPDKLKGELEPRSTQTRMIRSITELNEVGVRIKADENRQLLDISFGYRYGIAIRELRIPPLNINDHRGTVFRNIMAFEQCHNKCSPDVTTYLFFFNGLINSAEDVALLHYKGVLHHSLGSDKEVAKLINNISKEVVPDKNDSYLYKVVNGANSYFDSGYAKGINNISKEVVPDKNESYLHKVVNDANSYFDSGYAKGRAALVHYYLSSWVVGISTLGAFLALYFTFIQTVSGIVGALDDLKSYGFRWFIKDAFLLPFINAPSSELSAKKGGCDSDPKNLRELCMEICLTE